MANPTFDLTDNVLTIITDKLELHFCRGIVTYVKDIATSEELINVTGDPIADGSYPTGEDVKTCKFCGMTASFDEAFGWTYIRPTTSNPSENLVDTWHYQLIYNPCEYVYGPLTDSQLVYSFAVDSSNGEISISAAGTIPAGLTNLSNISISLLLMKATGSNGMIMANGKSYARGLGAVNDNIYGRWPQAGLDVGANSCVFCWSESTDYANDTLYFRHTADYDHIFFNHPQSEHSSALQVSAGPWWIGTYTNWLAAAKRWRQRYESASWFDATPLWDNPTANNFHAYYDYATLQAGGDRYSAVLASVENPSRLFLLAWNGGMNDYCMFADPTFTTNSLVPQTEIDAARSAGFASVVLYMPWTMYITQAGELLRIDYLAGTGIWDSYGPTGSDIRPGGASYTFTPHWNGGNNTDWYNTWAANDITAEASFGPYVHAIHAGSDEFIDYIKKNVADYLSIHDVQGIYFDIMGVVLRGGLKNNLSYTEGEREAMLQLNEAQAGLGPVIAEYICIDLPVPMNWYGAGPVAPENDLDLNHPFRTALIGSYIWTMDDNLKLVTTGDYNFTRFGLAGAMPQIARTGDYQIDNDLVPFLIARANMYCKFQLFNDLPSTTWRTTGVRTLNYLRSNTGNMFRYEDRGSGVYAYVEEHWQGDYDRLVIDTGVVTTDNIDEELPSSYYTRGSYISLPSDDTDLATPYNVDDIADVATDDTDMVAQLATSQIAIHQFKQQIAGTGGLISIVAQVTIPCSTSTTYLQIYNRSGTPAWDTIDSDNATGANTDFTLSATVADLTDYKDENNIVACRVYQEMQ